MGETAVTYSKGITRKNVIADPLRNLGRCIELVAIDPHFHDITVGLYMRDRTLTIHTFSQIDGTAERIETIRDRLCALAISRRPTPPTSRIDSKVLRAPIRFAY